MVARSLVLVLFHVGCALGVYGLSGLVADSAFAGTNEWTYQSGATGYNPICLPRSSLGAVVSCIGGQTIGNGVDVSCQVNSSAGAVTLVSGTTWQATVTIESENWNAFGCQGTFTSANKVVRFTDSCTPPSMFDGNECYTPPDCDDQAGLEADRYFADSGPGGAICANPPGSEALECSALVANPSGVRACAGGECFARLVFTGDQCGAEPDASGETLIDEPGNQNCVAGGGITFCAPQTSTNCGTVNGQSVCLDSVPPGRCTFLGNGGMVCAAGATGAPTEEDGVTPAEPDGTFTAESEDAAEEDYEYFGPGTVANSGTPVSGPSSSEGSEDEGEEPGGECDEPGACVGVVPELGETETVGEATSAFLAAIEGTPLIAAAMSIGTSMPPGECPVASDTIEYLGNMTLTIDAHCGLWDEIAVILSYVMLACWVFAGVRIVLSA